MGAYYDEIEIEDMVWDEDKSVYHYPCPCGDRFEISRSQLADCEDIATCPSCSLIIRVIFDPLDFEEEPPDDEDEYPSQEKDNRDEDSEDSDEDQFQDALEKLDLSDPPPHISVITLPIS